MCLFGNDEYTEYNENYDYDYDSSDGRFVANTVMSMSFLLIFTYMASVVIGL